MYWLNPLETIQKRWPGSIVIENVCAVGDGASANSIGVRIDSGINVKVRDCVLDGFRNGVALGGVTTYLTVERSIGRSHVCTPVPTAPLVCRLPLETQTPHPPPTPPPPPPPPPHP